MSDPAVQISDHDEEAITGYLKFLQHHNMTTEQAEEKFFRAPVDIATFINGESFMNKKDTVFPAVMDELIKVNNGRYVEAVFTGGIGSGKTTAALYTNCYQLYLLSCMRDVHGAFGLDSASEILLIFQNKTAELATKVDYARFKMMIDTSPYFQAYYNYNKRVASRLVFPERIEVVPVSGQESAAIGQNVMGGLIDELNYMDVTTQSKKSVDAGTYDQAVKIYNSIARRRKSRFMQHGELPGVLCLVSSRRYPGQFTDKKEAEAKTDPTIFIYDKCTWDVRPDAYSGETFPVFIGNLNKRPSILEEDEVDQYSPELVRRIPTEHKADFEADIINALREIAGVSTLSSAPYFMDHEKVAAAFGPVESILSDNEVDFSVRKLRMFPTQFREPQEPRWVHIDLGLTGDAAGVACGYVHKFVRIERGSSDEPEPFPEIVIDFTLRVVPPKADEIKFSKIRTLIYKLRDAGLNIRWISLDSFQSRDTIQILRQKGFHAGLVSVDRDTLAYDITKQAIYDGRLFAPSHDYLVTELLALERVPLKNKLDHPENMTKDVADALAGTVSGLTMRREIWINHGIPLTEIPDSIKIHSVRGSTSMKTSDDDDDDDDVID